MMDQVLRIEQRLILTPQLLLNLKLLQLPVLELEQLVRQELQNNPALEEVPDEEAVEELEPEVDRALAELSAGTEPPVPEPTLLDIEDRDKPEKPEIEELTNALDRGEIDIADFLGDEGFDVAEPVAPQSEADLQEAPDGEYASIGEVLLPLVKAKLDSADSAIAEAIVENLNEDGLLVASTAELQRQLNCPAEQLERVLNVIQHFESGGLAAHSVSEALILQLEVMGYTSESVEWRMLAECYESVARRQVAQIARMLTVTEERVLEALAVIAGLDPRPGRRYSRTNPGYIRPDFCIEWNNGRLTYYALDDSLPRLRLSRRCREILLNPRAHSKEEVAFARSKASGALMMIKGIESRRRTLNRLMEFILEQQREFLIQGREFMRQLTIRDAGRALNMHPTTISRAIQGKYVETPYAIMPIRQFFSAGRPGKSRFSVKNRIRRLIDGEDAFHPRSDAQIAQLLSQEGIKVSRRVVAKYRSEMNIPGCSQRRRQTASEQS